MKGKGGIRSTHGTSPGFATMEFIAEHLPFERLIMLCKDVCICIHNYVVDKTDLLVKWVGSYCNTSVWLVATCSSASVLLLIAVRH